MLINMFKKLTVNINSGLLEKSYNRNQRTFLSDKLEEAIYYINMYGGDIRVFIQETETHKHNII